MSHEKHNFNVWTKIIRKGIALYHLNIDTKLNPNKIKILRNSLSEEAILFKGVDDLKESLTITTFTNLVTFTSFSSLKITFFPLFICLQYLQKIYDTIQDNVTAPKPSNQLLIYLTNKL